jgi:hypothetical protein
MQIFCISSCILLIPYSEKSKKWDMAKAISHFFDLDSVQLVLGRSADRANARASAALNAGIRIDHILAIALRDRVHRALACAGAAADALIRNFICHKKTPPSIF